MSSIFFRKLKNSFRRKKHDSDQEGKFFFKRTSVKKPHHIGKERSTTRNVWNSKMFFLAILILSIMGYSVAQLAIGVYLDEQSKSLQDLREEETYLIEENKNISSKIAKHKSKIRVEIAASEDLKMKKSSEKDVVRISGGTVSAGLIE